STSKKPVCFMIHAPNQLKGNGITEQLSKPGGFSNPPAAVACFLSGFEMIKNRNGVNVRFLYFFFSVEI
ncbi:hypothetical protein, partial [Acetobacter farinalis]